MAEYVIQEATMTAIAQAIREKTGISLKMLPGTMPGYIRGIQSGSADTAGIPADIVAEAKRVANGMLSKIGSNALTFGVMSDMHEMGDGDHTDPVILERYRRANRNACQGMRLIADQVSLDFAANLGDLAWGSSSTTGEDLTASIVQAQRYMAPVMERVDCRMVPGNHDVDFADGFVDSRMIGGLVGSYGYQDFAQKKVRVIWLNTADTTDGTNATERISGEQLQWFAQTLDLSGKTDAAKWSIVILSHHPLDWGSIKPAADCLGAYLNGAAYSAAHDGMTVSYDYSGKNSAQVIGNFHGHVHCLKVGTISGTNAKRVAIPNACFGRSNEYGQGGNTEFGETTTYSKSDDGTGKNTAFCLVSVDLDRKLIYADCFGAGYDRIISYGEGEVVTYQVSNDLRNAVNSNSAAVVTEGTAYTARITANKGFLLHSVRVTMGGSDVTASVYEAGAINIPNVTGDLVITVRTDYEVNYDVTNLVLQSEEQNSTAVYNGIGYKNGIYASENGDGADAACVATGWIPYSWTPENVIYVRGAAVTSNTHVRFYGWKTKTAMSQHAYVSGDRLDSYFTVEELESGLYYKLTPKSTVSDVNYIRISLIGYGENLIITVNEPMGEGSAEEPEAGTYTNLVPTATSDGTTVFNAPYGYENGKYLSSSTANTYSSDAACVATGNIWMDSGVSAIYIKGAAWDTSNSHARFYSGSEVGGLGHTIHADGSGTISFDRFFVMQTLGTNYYKWTLTEDGRTYLTGKCYRISLVGTGENLVITHDEPVSD